MSFGEQFSELQTSEFDVKYRGKVLHFKMRETLGLDDERWITQFTDPQTLKVDGAGLWTKRLSTSMLEPKLASQDIQSLPKSLFETLRIRWAILNSFEDGDFLGSSKTMRNQKPAAI